MDDGRCNIAITVSVLTKLNGTVGLINQLASRTD